MSNYRMSLIGLLALCAWVTAVPAAAPDDEMEVALALLPDAQRGAQTYATYCLACHLEEAWGLEDGAFPQLAGQHRNVLIKQLADIRAGNRDVPTMMPFADPALIGGPQALADLAAYIAGFPMTPHNGVGAGDDLALGERIYRVQCQACHGEVAEGHNERLYPRLQGQHYAYLLRQLHWIRDGKRRNAHPEQVRLLKQLSERELAAVSDYVARLQPPPRDLAVAAPGPADRTDTAGWHVDWR